MRHIRDSRLAFLGGSLLGLAVGAALGILFAPARGSRTRRQLTRRAEEVGERVTELADDAKDALERGRRRFA
jgi:gas vesicle protein